MQVFEGLLVLPNHKKWRSLHADYNLCNIARTILGAKKQTYDKTNDETMKRL